MKRWLILLFSTVVWAQNWQPVYELFNPAMADHFYTMNQTEVENATNNMDYTNHGIIYYWSSVPFSGGIPIYRLWHSYDHFYTTSVVERDACVSNGYTDEGIVGYLATTNSGNLFGWHRYYHSDWDDHAILLVKMTVMFCLRLVILTKVYMVMSGWNQVTPAAVLISHLTLVGLVNCMISIIIRKSVFLGKVVTTARPVLIFGIMLICPVKTVLLIGRLIIILLLGQALANIP